MGKKYIDAEELRHRLALVWSIDVAQKIVDGMPAADVIEVCRCKDCKYAHMTMDGECKYCDIWFPDEKEYMPGDYYCASGERKNGDEK